MDARAADELELHLGGLPKAVQAMAIAHTLDREDQVPTPALVHYARSLSDERKLTKLVNLVVLSVMQGAPRKARVIALAMLFPPERFLAHWRRARPAPTEQTRREDAAYAGNEPQRRLFALLTFDPGELQRDLVGVLYGFFNIHRTVWIPRNMWYSVTYLLSVVNDVFFTEVYPYLGTRCVVYQVDAWLPQYRVNVIPKVLQGMRAFGAIGYTFGFNAWNRESDEIYAALRDVPAVRNTTNAMYVPQPVDTILVTSYLLQHDPDVYIADAKELATHHIVVWSDHPARIERTYTKNEAGEWM